MCIKNVDKKSMLKLVGLIALCQSVGIIGSLFANENALYWYEYLFKPDYMPTNSMFSIVWGILYLLIAISLFMVLQSEDSAGKRQAVIIFSIQLFLNALWMPVFFGLKSIIGALIIILLLLISIFIMFYKFYKLSAKAAYLLIPYILWVSYAIGLNVSILFLNM